MDKENISLSAVVSPSPRMMRKSSRLVKRISSVSSFDLSSLTLKGRKRKRKDDDTDDDSASVKSLDAICDTDARNGAAEGQSKRRSMAKMSSFVNTLSPAMATSKVSKAFERSFSFKTPNSARRGGKPMTPYKKPKPALGDKRASRCWYETVDPEVRASLTDVECKRQEAIYELVHGEEDLIEDLTMVDKLYHYSMRKLRLMTDEELDKIFGIVERLVPFHQELLKSMKALCNQNGTVDAVGPTLLDWIPNLRQYETYCANQIFAKGLLDSKKADAKVEDFLSRCQESSFSRKLDLWNFLDLPRKRLVKYPLLLKQIHKYTEDEHSDKADLLTVIEHIEDIIQDVDRKMGESTCRSTLDSLEFLFENPQAQLLEQCSSLLCSGQLKNDRGTKLHVFLFDQAFIVARQATRNNQLKYQVFKEPIPISDVEVVDLSETEGRRGSFKNKVLKQPLTDKHAFKVGSRGGAQSHVLQAHDEHDKRQWLNCLQKAVEPYQTDSYSDGKSSKSSSTTSLSSRLSLSNPDDANIQNDLRIETVV